MTEKQECFMCKRRYFADDPEFNAEKHICDNELEIDNPYNIYAYNGYDHDENDE